MTQEDLAFAGAASPRHLSCLETGRARPSRAIVERLAEALQLPLRARNELLTAAGFSSAFPQRPLADLGPALAAIERILAAHRPYPAFAVDRGWNVVVSNAALPQLYEGCNEDLLRAPLNAARLILHPRGMAPRILNYAAWRAHTVAVLREQLHASPDATIEALLAEVKSYPAPAPARATVPDASHRFATPLQVATRFGPLSFLSTNTVFGTPTDITLSELSLEMLFPADASTTAAVEAMVRETDAAAVAPPTAGRAQRVG